MAYAWMVGAAVTLVTSVPIAATVSAASRAAVPTAMKPGVRTIATDKECAWEANVLAGQPLPAAIAPFRCSATAHARTHAMSTCQTKAVSHVLGAASLASMEGSRVAYTTPLRISPLRYCRPLQITQSSSSSSSSSSSLCNKACKSPRRKWPAARSSGGIILR